MKLLLIVVLALVGTAFGDTSDCVVNDKDHAVACQTTTLADNLCNMPEVFATTTNNPVTFTLDATTSKAKVDFSGDKLYIEFDEAVTYFSKESVTAPVGDFKVPTLSFGNSLACTDVAQTFLTWTAPTIDWSTDDVTCTRHWKVEVAWASLLTLDCMMPYTESNTVSQRTETADKITYNIAFSVKNYEMIDVSRQSDATPEYVERTVEHALPFTIEFQTTVDVQSVVRVYAPIEVQAAITSQVVTMTDVVNSPNTADMELKLYTSIQYPFELELIPPAASGKSYKVLEEDGSYTTVDFTKRFAGSNSGISDTTASITGEGVCGVTVDNSDPQNIVYETTDLCVRTYTFTFHDIPTGTLPADDICNFNGDYLVPYDTVCSELENDPQGRVCPLDTAAADAGHYNGLITMTIASSRHCADVVDTIELTAGITSYRLDETTKVYASWSPFDYNDQNKIVTPAMIPDLQTASNFLDEQHIIFAVSVKSDDASMTDLWMNTISISDNGNPSELWRCPVGESCQRTVGTSGMTGDTLNVKHWGYSREIIDPNTDGFLYFGFQVVREHMSINFDENKPMTVTGTVEVKYLSAGQASTGFQVSSVKKMAIEESGTKNTEVSVTPTFVGPASSGSSTLGGASATVVGAAGLALGVLAGVILGVLIRKKREPVKSESKVELTAEV